MLQKKIADNLALFKIINVICSGFNHQSLKPLSEKISIKCEGLKSLKVGSEIPSKTVPKTSKCITKKNLLTELRSRF